jgi:putative FmdB family regulatory protein
MPIYEYYCPNCDAEYELVRPASRIDDPAPCKTCGQPGQRQLSGFSFKSNTFSAPRFKQAVIKPFRARDRQEQPEPSEAKSTPTS